LIFQISAEEEEEQGQALSTGAIQSLDQLILLYVGRMQM